MLLPHPSERVDFQKKRTLKNRVFLDPILDKKVKKSGFRILKCQHLYQKNIISSSPETPLESRGTV